jgi:hypothetical protein
MISVGDVVLLRERPKKQYGVVVHIQYRKQRKDDNWDWQFVECYHIIDCKYGVKLKVPPHRMFNIIPYKEAILECL